MQQILKLSKKYGFIFYALLVQQRPVTVARKGSAMLLLNMDVTNLWQFCSAFLSCEQYIFFIVPFESLYQS